MQTFFKRSLFLIICLFSAGLIYSQETRQARYVDGVEGLNKFFNENLQLDQFDLERNFHGTVVLRVQVNFLGTIDSMYVWFSPTRELGEEALRVLKLTSGSWLSWRKNGGFRNSWVQFPYHICRSSFCGYTGIYYSEYKKKSQKAFLGGDRDKGIEYLRKAVNVEPSFGEDFYRLATLLMEEGDDPAICRYFEIAQELTGNIYPGYLDYCGVDREQYLLRKQEEKQAFDAYIGHTSGLQPEGMSWEPAFTGDKPSIAHRYAGGADSVRAFLASSLHFPENAIRKAQCGLSVSSLTISPEGLVEEVAVLNSLGPGIDQEVMRLLRKTGGRWKGVDHYAGRQSFIFQINFGFSPNCRTKDHLTLLADTILDEITICAIKSQTKPKSKAQLKSYVEYLVSGTQYSDALLVLEEASRRDPFNPYYYEQKAVCYRGLGMNVMDSNTKGILEAYYGGDSLALLDGNRAIGSKRIIKATKDGGYAVKEISLDSAIIYSGKLSSVKPEIKSGKFYFFNELGKVSVTGQYQDDYPIGLWSYYSLSGEVTAVLDYKSVFEFLLEEETYPFVDSVYMGRTDLGANKNGSFSEVGTMPQFFDGDPQRTFRDYIKKQIKYPVYALHHGLEGQVLVQFTIDQEGRVRDPSIIKGTSQELNMEALRVIINSPLWTPGKLKKNPVAVVTTFQVDFFPNRRLFKGFY